MPIREWTGPAGSLAPRISGFDQPLVWIVLALVACGLVMVYSASVALPDSPKFARYAPTHFLCPPRAVHRAGAGGGGVALQVPVRVWEKWAPYIFVAALVLLVLVLIPGVGKVVNKSRRWIPLGVMNFQPSELAKLAMAMYAASYMVRKMEMKENFVKAVWPMAVALGFTGVLLQLREPDMGAFMVVALVSMGNPVSRRRQRPHVPAVGRGAGGRLRAGHRLQPGEERAHLRLPQALGPSLRAGQGLPAHTLIDRFRPG